MMKIKLFFVSTIVFVATYSVHAQSTCESLFGAANASVSASIQTSFPSGLKSLKGSFEFGTSTFEGAFSDLLQRSDFKQLLEAENNNSFRVIARLNLENEFSHQRLRLVNLNIGNGNRAYNHQELVALLNLNPELTAKLGLYKVEGYESFAWIPDMASLNERLKFLAEESGAQEPIWSYAQAEGVVSFQPYLKMLSEGKFPFSSENDINLFVHDTMHAVAFSALNSTPAARRIAEIARTRNKILYKVIERLRNELSYSSYSVESVAKNIATDPMERTMLLTILMTGNHHYFSPSVARDEGRFYTQQDPVITEKRVEHVLNLISRGANDFYSLYEHVINSSNNHALGTKADWQSKVSRIFNEEMMHLELPNQNEIQSAAKDIVEKFFAKKIFESHEGVPLNTDTRTDLSPNMPYTTFNAVERSIPQNQ